MLVGASGSGKTTAWRVLLKALERVEGVEGVAYVIDAKVCYKIWLLRHLGPNSDLGWFSSCINMDSLLCQILMLIEIEGDE